jgi:hypothetical protein
VALPAREVTAALLAVHRGIAYGWAIDEAEPGRALEIEARQGRAVLAQAWTGAGHAFGERLRSDVRDHLFALDLGRSPSSARAVDIVLSGSGQRIGTVHPAGRRARGLLPPLDVRALGLDGYCEHPVDTCLTGWVWAPAAPHLRLAVAVVADGRLVAVQRAAIPRDDLLAEGVGDGCHAFSIPIPEDLRYGRPRRIEALVAFAGVPLINGVQTLVGSWSCRK